jgi:hypothetical protein
MEWLMACRVMVDTADDILVSVAIDDMDAFPDIDVVVPIIEEGITNG